MIRHTCSCGCRSVGAIRCPMCSARIPAIGGLSAETVRSLVPPEEFPKLGRLAAEWRRYWASARVRGVPIDFGPAEQNAAAQVLRDLADRLEHDHDGKRGADRSAPNPVVEVELGDWYLAERQDR